MNKSSHFLITVKSGNLENFITAYNFTVAVLKNSNALIKMIFFYQNGCNILLNSEISFKWQELLNKNNLYAAVCVSSYKKRGIKLKDPFKSSSLLEFINTSEIVDKIIQF